MIVSLWIKSTASAGQLLVSHTDATGGDYTAIQRTPPDSGNNVYQASGTPTVPVNTSRSIRYRSSNAYGIDIYVIGWVDNR